MGKVALELKAPFFLGGGQPGGSRLAAQMHALPGAIAQRPSGGRAEVGRAGGGEGPGRGDPTRKFTEAQPMQRGCELGIQVNKRASQPMG